MRSLLCFFLLFPFAAFARVMPASENGMPKSPPEVRVVRGEPAVAVWPRTPFQGAVLVVDVAGATAATGKFGKQPLRFYRLDESTLRGLAPVPDDAPTGTATLALTLEVPGRKKPVVRKVPLVVRGLAFEKDKLSVDPRFLKPPPEVLPQIEADKKAVAAVWARGSPDAPLFTGAFQIPREDRTTAPFGTRRVYNGQTRSVHQGWDIDGEVGDPILCDNDGVVAMTRELYYSGGTMFIDHGAGVYSVYFHMSEFAVKEGDRVTKGQLCGKVGQSGRVTGPHLHWAAKVGGVYVHPGSLLLIDWTRSMIPAAGGAK
jgi:murein DD-endopeptidase MepM/ murein hydrolase activator NlpD